jgi:tyrosyl-tRNA synthetase
VTPAVSRLPALCFPPNEIESNAKTYMDQFFKVVDKDKTEVKWQSEWFSVFTLSDVIKLTSKFTVAQLLAREDFSRRYDSGNPISLTEMLYPLLQGYDSAVIKADVEFGGTDQKFNCLVGRELQQSMGQPPQQVFLLPILVGTDGNQKMSKSLKNHIGIAEPPHEIYGKVMSIPDQLILDYFELVTDVPEEEIAEFKEQLATRSVNPMNLKKRLAYEIVGQFHGKPAADEAQEHFTQIFQKREMPEEIAEYTFAATDIGDDLYQLDIAPTLVKEGVVKGSGELKRLLAQQAIEIDGKKISSTTVNARQGSIIKIGKRRFVRIDIKGADSTH